MAKKRHIPEQTSTLAFQEYVSSPPVLSSADAGWQQLLVRTYIEPQAKDYLYVPSVPDPYIVLQFSGATRLELKEDSSSWSTVRSRPGHLFFTAAGGNPYEMRWVNESDEPIETVHLHLNAKLLAKTGEEAAGIDPSRIEILERSAVRDPFVEQVCLMLRQELNKGGVGGNFYAETAAQLLAVHLLREHCTFEYRVKEYSGGLPGNRLRRVMEYVKTHLDADLSLDDLALQVGMSAYHFSRLFKQSTGESPHQYVVRLRIEEAKRLLKETDKSILEVALEVGYNSPSHLATQFKRLTGIAPSTYRNAS